ncbi:keratin, type I cytoskeletal 18-A isoform X1 [Cyprinodon tularosa]|uniref:keratin, type I cytoskeletal 18-A isoform X1 n=2 Tax=Cyprinodon tularosa TaxID=77115 RepID=UPI0018E26AAA|nr:keratin, type I cytoskeletal 18-A isoform X1 [Cyprinodon tularosa]XP_038134918.1 keratin, type I cytoskeletal 18-A isoform X1 [Cyprinodon tularosa]XP_038134919.1 keratin, type I cytoskeletal 18-A isoform X1 [Cyprinodon tularosa]
MDLLQDSSQSMWDLNARLKNFMEQVNGLQEANRQLEAQIVEWSFRSASRSQNWSKQEQTVKELRSQICIVLIENAQLALECDNMRSRASAIQARCETEERTTRRLEQQVALLREAKREADESSVTLQAECHRSMTELQHMDQEFEAAQALLLQRARSCDALLAAAAAGREEEDGTGMELTQLLDQIRVQCDQSRHTGLPERLLGLGTASDPAAGSVGPGRSDSGGAAAFRTHRGALTEEEAAWAQVNLGGAALKEARAELTEARKQWRSLQVEMETLHALERGLECTLQHTQDLYTSQLQDLSQVILRLEGELEQVREGLATQRQRHSQLLNTKMKLEREIATYRRLLEREEGRYMQGRCVQPLRLRPWRSPVLEPKENGLENSFSDSVVTPDEPKSEPLPDIPSLLPADQELKKSKLYRQQSLVILTEPEQDKDLPLATVKTQEILQGKVVQESAEGHGTIETEKIDKVIKQWEGSFFRGNPKLRKKSVSLRFDLHMAAADEGCAQTKQDSLPDVEVRLIMKRSRSISTITQ